MRLLLSAALAALIVSPALAEDYATRLTAVAYDGAMRDNVQGDGHVTATLTGSTLSVKGDFSALPSAATSVKLYSGPGIGVPGPAIKDIAMSGKMDGSFSASVTLSGKELAALKRGHVYLQIDSEKALDGNLWGWLLPARAYPGDDVPEKGHGFLPNLDIPGNWTEK
jgi:hypothetical protein